MTRDEALTYLRETCGSDTSEGVKAWLDAWGWTMYFSRSTGYFEPMGMCAYVQPGASIRHCDQISEVAAAQAIAHAIERYR